MIDSSPEQQFHCDSPTQIMEDNPPPTTDAPTEAVANHPSDPITQIIVHIKDQHNNELMFRVKPTTLWGKIMDNYSTRMGVDLSRARFLFDGQRIQKTDTPQSLDMADEDIVEVFEEMIGGEGQGV